MQYVAVYNPTSMPLLVQLLGREDDPNVYLSNPPHSFTGLNGPNGHHSRRMSGLDRTPQFQRGVQTGKVRLGWGGVSKGAVRSLG